MLDDQLTIMQRRRVQMLKQRRYQLQQQIDTIDAELAALAAPALQDRSAKAIREVPDQTKI